jgi:hypothetical protein
MARDMNKVILVLIVACKMLAGIMLITDLPSTWKVHPVKQEVFTAKSI